MQKIIAFAMVSVLFISVSCSSDKSEDPNLCAYDVAQLKYNGLIKAIISKNCSALGSCHGSPQEQNAGGELTSYVLLKEKVDNNSLNDRVFERKDMPQGSSLDVCEFKQLKDWVNAGAP